LTDLDLEEINKCVKEFYSLYWSDNDEDFLPTKPVLKGTRVDREKRQKEIEQNRMAAEVQANIQRLLQQLTDQNNRPPRLKPAAPGTFSGRTDENIRQWFQRVETFFDASATPDADKPAFLKTLLKGEAYDVARKVQPIGPADVNGIMPPVTYDDIKEALLHHFLGAHRQYVLRSDLDERKLAKSESLDDYMRDILEKASLLDLGDDEKQRLLLRGLPGSLRSEIISHQPANLDELINRIRLSETVDKMRKSEKGIAARALMFGDNEEQSAGMLVTLLEAITRMREDVKALQNGISSPKREEKSYPVKGNNQSNGKRRCYRCGREGHLKYECRAKKHVNGYIINDGKPPQQIGTPSTGPMPNQVMWVSVPTTQQPPTAANATTSYISQSN